MRVSAAFQMLIFLIFGGICSIILKQDVSFDFRNYHFYTPYAFLNNRYSYDIAPAQMQTFINPTMDVLYYKLVIMLQNPTMISFIMGLWYGLFSWAVFRLISALQKNNFVVNFVATLLAITGVSAVSQIGLTSNEVAISSLLMCSILLVFSALIRPCFSAGIINNTHQLWLAGLLAGLAVGFKLTAAGFVLALWVTIGVVLWSRRDTRITSWLIQFGIFSFLGFCITGAHWHIFMFYHYQNPFFPMFNSFFKSHYFDFNELTVSSYRALNIEKMITLPFLITFRNSNLVGERWFSDPRLLIGYVSVFVFFITLFVRRLMIVKRKNEELLFFATLWIISYIIWAYLHGIYRYAVTLESLSIILLIGLLKEFNFRRVTQLFILFPLIIFVFSVTTYNGWDRLYNPSSKALDVKTPLMPPNSLVILTSAEPLSYLIPFFDSSVRFVSPVSNFMFPENKNLLQLKVNELIKTWQGTIFIVFPNRYDIKKDKALDYFNLTVDSSSSIKACRGIYSNIDLSPPYICRLRRVKN